MGRRRDIDERSGRLYPPIVSRLNLKLGYLSLPKSYSRVMNPGESRIEALRAE
jgi:hypothetical protein